MPTLESDPFTYGNGNLATVSAAKFTKLSTKSDPVISSNRLSGVADVDAAAVLTAWAGSLTDQWAACTVFGASMQFGGPTICGDAVGSFYVFDVRSTSDQYVYLVTPGPTYTPIAGPVTRALVAGDVVYIERVAGVITTKINGAIANVVTNTTLVSGKPGVRFFSLGTQVDDWAAGDFSVGGGFQSAWARGSNAVLGAEAH